MKYITTKKGQLIQQFNSPILSPVNDQKKAQNDSHPMKRKLGISNTEDDVMKISPEDLAGLEYKVSQQP